MCSLSNKCPGIFDDVLCVIIEECKHNTTPHPFLKIATLLNAPLAIYKLKQLNHKDFPMFEEETFYETTVYSCLHMAYQNEHTELAKSLLVNNYLIDSHGFENNFFNKSTYTKTPLHTACSNNHLAIVKLLLKFEHNNDYGFPKFNYKTGITEKISALAVACLNSNLEIIKLLLEDGTNKHLGQMCN